MGWTILTAPQTPARSDVDGWEAWPPPAYWEKVAYTFADLNHDGRPDFVGNIGDNPLINVCMRLPNGGVGPQTRYDVGGSEIPTASKPGP